MKQPDSVLRYEFVEFVPEEISQGVLYISIPYATAVHLCCCGCGHEVVTPLSPTDWSLIFDGTTVSLDPSIGNWSFECQSHYFIKRNRIEWWDKWSKERINNGRAFDKIRKDHYYVTSNTTVSPGTDATHMLREEVSKGIFSNIRRLWPF